MTDDKRLIDEADPLSEALLRSADADRPSPAARKAAAAALGLTAVATPADASAVSSTATGSVLGKLGIAALIGGGIAVGIVQSREAPPVTSPPAPITAPAPEPEPEIVPEPEPEPEPEPSAVVEEKPAPKTRAERPKKKRPSLDEEVRLIDAARSAVESGAHTRALRTLRTYRRRFEKGMLREEADALNVTALAGAGKSDDARRAFEAFGRRYPQSSHAARLRRLFE